MRFIAFCLALSLVLACSSADTPAQTPVDVAPDVPAAPEDTTAPPDVAEPPPEDTGPALPPLIDHGPQPVADGAWEWLQNDDGTGAGAHNYSETPDAYYEYSRFEVFQPFRLRALKVQVKVPAAGKLTLYVWDDFSGDFLDLDTETPLATATRDVTPEDADTWLELPIDPPLSIDPGRIFFAGTIVNGAKAPRIVVDAAQTAVPDKSTPSIVWQSKKVDPETGTHTVFAQAAGDYLLRVEVQRFDVIQGDEYLFEKIDPADVPPIGRGALDDVDGDGDLDLMVGGPKLYRNEGGKLIDVSAEALPAGVGCNGGAFGDYDDDGDPDWLGAGDAEILLRNDGGKFTDVSATAGIDDSQEINCLGEKKTMHGTTEAAAWLDADGDGLLDVYLANYECASLGPATRDFFFHNNGDGTFTDATASSGVAAAESKSLAGRGLSPADYDGDGDVDLLVANYRLHPNLMLRNDGAGHFTDVGKATTLMGVPSTSGGGLAYGHSIGAVWGDVNNDGALDVFVANLAHPRFIAFSQKASLYISTGGADPTFDDATLDAGIRYQETASNPNAWDFDDDGDLDLIWTCVYAFRPSQFYRNDFPDFAWKEVTYPSGLAVSGAWGSITGDIDGDGDLDYLSNAAFRNRNRFGNRSIEVRPLGSGKGKTNRSGYGARVRVTAGGRKQMQEAHGAHGTGCQDSPWLHFGLGKATSADVTVSFPLSKTELKLPGLAPGRYTVREDGTLEKN